MDAKHYNELIELSQKIYDQSTETVTNYLSNKYCAVGNDTSEAQLRITCLLPKKPPPIFLAMPWPFWTQAPGKRRSRPLRKTSAG